jgi:hypothetical protein
MRRKRLKIGWDISHQEFTIEDHYYYSTLKSKIKEMGGQVREVRSFKDIVNFDVLVLNYPEKPFVKSEVKMVRNFLELGKNVIAAGYYGNEDMIADNINSISTHFGISLKTDRVRDKENNFKGDDLLVVTSRVLSCDYKIAKVLLPCCSSISVNRRLATEFVLSERSQVTNSIRKKILAAHSLVGEGKFILIGTCAFWDNFAINKFSNMRFALNLLFKP